MTVDIVKQNNRLLSTTAVRKKIYSLSKSAVSANEPVVGRLKQGRKKCLTINRIQD